MKQTYPKDKFKLYYRLEYHQIDIEKGLVDGDCYYVDIYVWDLKFPFVHKKMIEYKYDEAFHVWRKGEIF